MLIDDAGRQVRPFQPPPQPVQPQPRPPKVYGPYVTHAPAAAPVPCVIDDLRRRRDDMQLQAQVARQAAEAARQQAEHARAQAEAAQARAKGSKDPALKEEAARQCSLAEDQDLAARKAEAAASLKEAEHRELACSVIDAEEGRGPDRPSQATLAAQDDVKQKQFSASLLEPPPAGQASPLQDASANTDGLLKEAQKAAKPVFDAWARGKEPSKKQLEEMNEKVGAYQEAAAHEARVAGMQAQARGEDPVAAMAKQGDAIAGRIPKTGLFGRPGVREQIGKIVDDTLKPLKAESTAERQLAVESREAGIRYDKQHEGAVKAAADADKKADQAETYAAGYAGVDSEAATSARQNARHFRQLANDAAQRVARQEKEQQIDNVDFWIQGQKLEVDGIGAQYQQALKGDNLQKVLDLGSQQGQALGGLKTLESLREKLAADLEVSDAQAADDAAKAAWTNESGSQPQLIHVQSRPTGGRGGGVTSSTIQPEGYDRTFWAVPGKSGLHASPDAGNVRRGDDGKYYLETDQGFGRHKREELNPTTAHLHATGDRLEAAQLRAREAGAAYNLNVESLGNPITGQTGRLDVSAWEGRAGKIGQQLSQADQAVEAARQAIATAELHGAPPERIEELKIDLGKSLQEQKFAQAQSETLSMVVDWRSKQQALAAGPGSGVTQEQVDDLRGKVLAKLDATQGTQLDRVDAADRNQLVRPGQYEKLCKDRAADDKRLEEARQKVQKAQESGNQQEVRKALDEQEWVELDIRDHDNQISQAELVYLRTADEEAFGRMDTQGPPDTQVNLGGNYVSSPSKDHPVNGGDSHYAIAPPQNALQVMVNASQHDDGSWTATDGSGIKLSADRKTWTFPDSKQITERDGKFYVSFEESRGQVGESTATTVRTPEQELHPLAARLWRNNAEAWEARTGAGKVAEDREGFLAMHPGTAPAAEGIDGQPAPLLTFDEDLDKRLEQVQGTVDGLNNELAKLPPPGAVLALEPQRTQLLLQLDLAAAELGAVQAMQAWKSAHYNNKMILQQGPGGARDASAIVGADDMDELEARALSARDKWVQQHDRQIVEAKQQDVNDLNVLHEQWKSANPGFTPAQERGSESWNKLEDAKANLRNTQDLQAGKTATAAANTTQQEWVREHLRPDQNGDNRELYKLFQDNPQVMAQGLINEHYQRYKDPILMQDRTHLGNEVAIALGWPPSRKIDSPGAAAYARLHEDIFSAGLTEQQRTMHQAVVDQITELGGNHAKVTVLPVVYGLNERGGGVVKTALFKVDCTDGTVKYVDETGRRYNDLKDYRDNNTSLPVDGAKAVIPEGGSYSLDASGNVKLQVQEANHESGWDKFSRSNAVNWAIGGASVLAGIVLTVGSGGTLIAAGATLVLVGGSMFGAATSAKNLHDRASHGQSISLSDSQARLDWLNLGASAFALPTMGVAGKAARLGLQAKGATEAGDAALHASAKAWERAGKVLAVPTTGLGLGAFGQGAYDLAENWEYMSDSEKWNQGGMMLLNVADMGSGRMLRGIAARRAAAAGAAAVAVPGQPAVGAPPPVVAAPAPPGGAAVPAGLPSAAGGAPAPAPLPASGGGPVAPAVAAATPAAAGSGPALMPVAAVAPLGPLQGPAPGAASRAGEARGDQRGRPDEPASTAGHEARGAGPARPVRRSARLIAAGPVPQPPGREGSRPLFPEDRMLPLHPSYEHELTETSLDPIDPTYRFLGDGERAKRRLTIGEDGRLRDRNGNLYNTPVGHVSSDRKAVTTGYVMDREGNFYPHAASEEAVWAAGRVGGDHKPLRGGFDNRMVHASVPGGRPVAMAGIWEVRDGVVRYLSNKSGHYRPEVANFEFARGFMAERGLDLSQARIEVFTSDDQTSVVIAPGPTGVPDGITVDHGDRYWRSETVNARDSQVNCVPSAITMDLRWADPDVEVQAVPLGPWSTEVVRAQYGDPPLLPFGSHSQVLQHLGALPEGSRGFVILGAGTDADARAHMINYRVHGGKVQLVDAQAGKFVKRFEASQVFVMETHRGGTVPRDVHVLDAQRLARMRDAAQDELGEGPGQVFGPPVPPPDGTGAQPEGVPATPADPPDPTATTVSISTRGVQITRPARPGRNPDEVFAVAMDDPSTVGRKPGLAVPAAVTFASFDEAAGHAATQAGGNGAWVYRISPDPEHPGLDTRQAVYASEVSGAVHVGADGAVTLKGKDLFSGSDDEIAFDVSQLLEGDLNGRSAREREAALVEDALWITRAMPSGSDRSGSILTRQGMDEDRSSRWFRMDKVEREDAAARATKVLTDLLGPNWRDVAGLKLEQSGQVVVFRFSDIHLHVGGRSNGYGIHNPPGPRIEQVFQRSDERRGAELQQAMIFAVPDATSKTPYYMMLEHKGAVFKVFLDRNGKLMTDSIKWDAGGVSIKPEDFVKSLRDLHPDLKQRLEWMPGANGGGDYVETFVVPATKLHWQGFERGKATMHEVMALWERGRGDLAQRLNIGLIGGQMADEQGVFNIVEELIEANRLDPSGTKLYIVGGGELTGVKEGVTKNHELKISAADLENPHNGLDLQLQLYAKAGGLVVVHFDADDPIYLDGSNGSILVSQVSGTKNLDALYAAFDQYRDAKPVHAHWGGLSRSAGPSSAHAATIREFLEMTPNAYIDASWDAAGRRIYQDDRLSKVYSDLVNEFPTRFISGSDEVAQKDNFKGAVRLQLESGFARRLDHPELFYVGNFERVVGEARANMGAFRRNNAGLLVPELIDRNQAVPDLLDQLRSFKDVE